MTDNPRPETICFIGLGTMGREMAINLMKAGHRVQAFDVRHDAVDDLATHGAQACRSVATAARDAAIAITMLPDTPDVESVVYGDDGRHAPQSDDMTRSFAHPRMVVCACQSTLPPRARCQRTA